MEQKAKKYINSLYIDYGDLNEKAEEQIKQAFIDGMKEQLLIHSVVDTLCQHQWVDAKNIAVESGKLCVKCHSVKA